jgi:hypothetical protein
MNRFKQNEDFDPTEEGLIHPDQYQELLASIQGTD